MAGTTEWNAGLTKADAWGTPLLIDDGAAGSGHRVKFESDSMPPGFPEVIKDDNVGEPMSGATFQGNLSVEGQMSIPARYEQLSFLTAMLMGQDTYTVNDLTLGDHEQVFQNSNTGNYLTLVLDREFGTLWEYQTCKVSQIELSHSDGKLVCSPTLIANRCERAAPLAHEIKDGDTNPAAFRAPGDLILFNHLRVAMQEVDGADTNLDMGETTGADLYRVTDLKITANRNVTGNHESGSDAPATSGGPVPGAGEIGEPETDGMPEGQVEITFANHSALVDAIVKEAQIRQPGSVPKVYKLTAKWTGRPNPNATTPPIGYLFQGDFAALTIADAPIQAGGPGAKTPVTITFNIVTPQVLPLGTDWTTWCDTIGQKPFRFFYTNSLQVSELV